MTPPTKTVLALIIGLAAGAPRAVAGEDRAIGPYFLAYADDAGYRDGDLVGVWLNTADLARGRPDDTDSPLAQFVRKSQQKSGSVKISEKVQSLEPIGFGRSIRTGSRLWIWLRGKSLESLCETIAIETYDGDHPPIIRLNARLTKPISSLAEDLRDQYGHLLFSLRPFPPKTWKERPPQVGELSLIRRAAGRARKGRARQSAKVRVIETQTQGTFAILSEETLNDSAEFVYYSHHILRKEGGGDWRKVGEFDDQVLYDLIDVDGDGVPEIFCNTGYKSAVMRSIFPEIRVVVRGSSGA